MAPFTWLQLPKVSLESGSLSAQSAVQPQDVRKTNGCLDAVNASKDISLTLYIVQCIPHPHPVSIIGRPFDGQKKKEIVRLTSSDENLRNADAHESSHSMSGAFRQPFV